MNVCEGQTPDSLQSSRSCSPAETRTSGGCPHEGAGSKRLAGQSGAVAVSQANPIHSGGVDVISDIGERRFGVTRRKSEARHEITPPRWVWRVGNAEPTRRLNPGPTWIEPIFVTPISRFHSVVIAQCEELEVLSRSVLG